MFFHTRLKSIKKNDKVLEIGPGGTPHARADVFLDIHPDNFKDDEEARYQRGSAPKLKTGKPIIYYDGTTFPFDDGEFDYIICSHVLEHVIDVPKFLSEVFRVGKSGYIEFPTFLYDYLYNIPVHHQFLHFDQQNRVLYYMAKEDTNLSQFSKAQGILLTTLEKGYVELVDCLKDSMFEGFEWKSPFSIKQVDNLDLLINLSQPIKKKPIPRLIQPEKVYIEKDFDRYGIKSLSKEIYKKVVNKIR